MNSPETTLARKEKLAETAAQLEQDIDALRNSLGVVARELDRRRHRFFQIPAGLKRNARPLAVGSVAVLALGLGAWWLRRSRARGAGRLLALLPASLAPSALVKAIKDRATTALTPQPPTHPVRASLWKISTAGMTGAAAVLGKTAASHLAEMDWSALRAGASSGSFKVDANKDASFGR